MNSEESKVMNPLKFYWVKPEFQRIIVVYKDGQTVWFDPAWYRKTFPNMCFVSRLDLNCGLAKVWLCNMTLVKLLKTEPSRENYVRWVNPNVLEEITDL